MERKTRIINIHNKNNKNIEYYNRSKEKQFYISAIDGKAIIRSFSLFSFLIILNMGKKVRSINVQRINVNRQFKIEKNNISNKIENNNDINCFGLFFYIFNIFNRNIKHN